MVLRNRAFEPAWVAGVRSTADRLAAELLRTGKQGTADYEITETAIGRARALAERPFLQVSGRFRRSRRSWRRFGSWWTGDDVDEAWGALHEAGQALLDIQAANVVKAQLGDMAATAVTSLSRGDMRIRDYLDTLRLLAPADRQITAADRAQLRAIRQASDSSSDSGHADARAYRNTLMLVGALLAVVLVGVAALAFGDSAFRHVFNPTDGVAGRWFVLEIEVVGSLAGVTGAVLGLRKYSGFQSTYGLPLVQAFLKGGTGAATGLFGVLLVQSGIVTALTAQASAGVFAYAVIFGYAQHLFTRLVDQQTKAVLASASSRNDPATTPTVPAQTDQPGLLTTDTTDQPAQVAPGRGRVRAGAARKARA
jgi:hypothetical protein